MEIPALALAVFLACGVDPGMSPTPNVVVISLDTTRADHLSTYGYVRDTDPGLRKLAAESVVFDQLLVPMATTLPSHASLFTGTEPLEHGVLANSKHGGALFRPSPALRTWAQVLRQHGYRTGAFVSATPLKQGSGIEAGFESYDEPRTVHREASLTTARALRFLGQTGEQPFFLWVHYFDPHGPFVAPKRHVRRFRDGDEITAWLQERDVAAQSTRPTGQVLSAVEAANGYDGEIHFMDRHLSRVLQRCRDAEWWDRTVVIVVGDHGEGLGQHGIAGHGGVWREQLHAPLIVRTPWHTAQRVSTPIGMADVLPTVLGMIDVPGADVLEAQSSGQDVLKAGRGRALYHHASERQTELGAAADALSVGPWRLVRAESGRTQLFHLTDDPHERSDLAQLLPVHTRLLDAWTTQTREALSRRGEALGRAESMSVDNERLEQLRSLGYVDEGAAPSEEADGWP